MCMGHTCIKPPACNCDRTCTQSTLRTTVRMWRKLKLFETVTVFGARKQFPGDITECFLSNPSPLSPPVFVYVLPNGDQHQQGWLMTTAACRPTHLHNLLKTNNTLLEGCLVVESMWCSSRRHHNLTVAQDENSRGSFLYVVSFLSG